MQVLNRIDGTFQAADEQLASALAAQCAVALQRVQMIESLIEGEKMRREMEMAQVVQMSTLPQAMPDVAGYDVHGTFRPALLTGGDTFDLAPVGDGLLVVLGDATGHGIAPALSVTQMHAMLRIAFRLGAALETAFAQVNDLLAETLAEDRFVTAFIGVLDPRAHVLRYVSAGQGPILHFHADRGTCSRHKPTSFPLGAMALPRPPRAAEMIFAPGDVLVLLSDGIYEYGNGAGEQFGEDRVEQVVAGHHAHGMAALSAALLDAVQAFAGGAAQEDDITVVLVRRGPAVSESAAFARRIDVLAEIVAFTTAAFARQGIPAALRADVDFVLEELFTNIVKYGRGKAPVAIEIAAIPGGVEVTLTEPEADRFDVTQASPVDVTLPAVQRQPGGLGLHLIPRLVDSVQYGYSEGERCSRIVFRKTDAAPSPGVAGHNEDQRC